MKSEFAKKEAELAATFEPTEMKNALNSSTKVFRLTIKHNRIQ